MRLNLNNTKHKKNGNNNLIEKKILLERQLDLYEEDSRKVSEILYQLQFIEHKLKITS